jgi:hypothetical protein
MIGNFMVNPLTVENFNVFKKKGVGQQDCVGEPIKLRQTNKQLGS